MKLIEYEVGSDVLRDEGFVEFNNLTMFQVLQLKQGNDIAHSLSIVAETMSAQYEQSKGLISASQSMLDNAEKELAKLNDE